MNREILSHRVPVICDFCSGQPVKWSYPCSNFEVAPGYLSLDRWAACEKCAGYIEDDHYELLLERVEHYYELLLGELGFHLRSPHLRLALCALHCQFKAHRTGSREPYAHHPDDGFTIREEVE